MFSKPVTGEIEDIRDRLFEIATSKFLEGHTDASVAISALACDLDDIIIEHGYQPERVQ